MPNQIICIGQAGSSAWASISSMVLTLRNVVLSLKLSGTSSRVVLVACGEDQLLASSPQGQAYCSPVFRDERSHRLALGFRTFTADRIEM